MDADALSCIAAFDSRGVFHVNAPAGRRFVATDGAAERRGTRGRGFSHLFSPQRGEGLRRRAQRPSTIPLSLPGRLPPDDRIHGFRCVSPVATVLGPVGAGCPCCSAFIRVHPWPVQTLWKDQRPRERRTGFETPGGTSRFCSDALIKTVASRTGGPRRRRLATVQVGSCISRRERTSPVPH